MKVLDLVCPNAHAFEGWFGSEDDFQSQMAQRQVTCPICHSPELVRLPCAPRLNLSGTATGRSAAADQDQKGAATTPPDDDAKPLPSASQEQPAPTHMPIVDPANFARQGEWLKQIRQLLAQTEDVGARFADEARKIHYSETPARTICGTANREQILELHEEGIEVMAIPAAFKEPLQ
jgi:hypothetical protein